MKRTHWQSLAAALVIAGLAPSVEVAADESAPKAEFASDSAPAKKLAEINDVLNWQRVDAAAYAGAVEELLKQWVTVDPQAAMAYALQPLTDDSVNAVFLEVAGNVMEFWAKHDPVAARTYFEHLGSKDAAKILAPWVVLGYGSQAPESAMEWVYAGLGKDREYLKPIMAKALVDVFEAQGKREILKHWLAMGDVASSGYSRPAAGDLARRLARTNPEEAMRFCAELPMGSLVRGTAVAEALRQWSSGDPAGAHAWLASRGEK